MSWTSREEAEARRAEAQRRKAERDAVLAAEEQSQRPTAKNANARTATKKTRGTLDLSKLDESPTGSTGRKAAALNASGIDNALDALTLASNSDTAKIDRHPERRFKAAYATFEARRLPEIEQEHPGLRRQQKVEIIRKEFEKSEENPFNKANVAFDATREEVEMVKAAEREKIEVRLAEK
jgi:Coiled-coil domain-containing protein 124 /Oxs1